MTYSIVCSATGVVLNLHYEYIRDMSRAYACHASRTFVPCLHQHSCSLESIESLDSHDTLQHTVAVCTLHHTATHCNTLQRTATHCNALQHTSTLCNTATHCIILQHTSTLCNTLQHTATHCNTLQYTATHCNTLQRTATH